MTPVQEEDEPLASSRPTFHARHTWSEHRIQVGSLGRDPLQHIQSEDINARCSFRLPLRSQPLSVELVYSIDHPELQ
jgi:hypothetical protein